jgi:peptidoglycan/xylan/chitin deacetylase (PgdA/CDA1 family)
MSAQSSSFSIETLIDILVADPDRLETHKYAEMGIPMFLIGEDRSGEAPIWPSAGRATSELGDRFAELCGALALRKPALDHDDIAKLLEVLAERHFLAHRTSTDVSEPFEGSTELLLPSAAPPVLAEIAQGLARSRAIRLVNFHATPRYREAEFRQQIAEYAELFEPITPANFAAALEGRWPHARPGLLPALFEGYRDNLDVLLPILEEYGFTAWLFVPSGFLTVPAEEQRSYAAAHVLHLPEQDEYPDQRIALTWDEAREIVQRGHVFACHTRTHREVTPDTPRAVLEEEIIVARAEMTRELGVAPDIFCWLEGAPLGTNPEADALLREAGFRYLISNFKIQRLQ